MYLRVLIATLILSWTAVAHADDVRGVIQKVDPDKHQLVLQLRGRGARASTLTFTVSPDTSIQISGQPGKLGDLQPGQRASLSYENQEGRRVALGINAHGSLFKQEATAPDKSADPNAVNGVLARVASSDREIVVFGRGPKGEADYETTIVVPEKATIVKDANPLKFDDLKEGEAVSVKTENRNGKMEAVSIQVGKAGPPRAVGSKDRIERLRDALRMADQFLQQLSDKK